MPPIGSIIGNRYKLLQNIARGGMSNIYLTEDIRLAGKKWVLKEFSAQYNNKEEQSKALEHFQREASLLANLEHRNLPKVVDHFSEGGNHYFVMEFVEGEDLSRILARSPGPIPEKLVIDWAIQIATVLYYLHCRKPKPIIFRDLKPSNIMLSGNTIKLIDFGIARHFTPGKKGDTMRIGSPGYAPPEQYSGQTDPRSDVFSFGVTLLQLLTKFDPTTTQTPFKFPQIRTLNPAVSPQMARIIEKAINIDPTQRYQTAIEMKKDLQTLIRSEQTSPAQFIRPSGVPTLPVTPLIPPTAVQQGSVQPQPPVQTPADFKQQQEAYVQQNLSAQKPTPMKGAKQSIAALKPPRKSSKLKIITVLIFLSIIITGSYYLMNNDTLINKGREFISKLGIIPNNEIDYDRTYPEDMLVRKGIIFLNAGDFKNAFEQFDKVRASFPDDGETLLYLNNAYILASNSENYSVGLAISSDGSRAHKDTRKIFRGIALAQHTINKKGGIKGKKIQIIPRVYHEKRLINSLKELSLNPEILAIIADFSPKDIPKCVSVLKKSGVPLLLSGKSYHTSIELPVYALPPPVANSYSALAHFAKEDIKPMCIALVYNIETNPPGKEDFRSVIGTASRIVDCPYSQKEFNAQTLAQKIVSSNPDLVTMAFDISQEQERKNLEAILKELQESRARLNFLLPEGLFYYVTRGSLQNLIQGSLWGILPVEPDKDNSRFDEYMRDYYVTYQNYPEDGESAVAYDAMTLIAMAIEDNKNTRTLIKDYLTELSSAGTYSGASGMVIFKTGKVSTKWLCISREKDGKLKLIKTLEI